MFAYLFVGFVIAISVVTIIWSANVWVELERQNELKTDEEIQEWWG